jgi:glycosyltransferase involved in cell wall biosynthesis
MNDQPGVLVANAGTLHLFHVAAELRRHGLLRRCATTLHFRSGGLPALPKAVRNAFLRRTANRRCAELDGLVETLAWPELLHLAASRLGIGAAGNWIAWRNPLFCRWAARHCLEGVKLVWAFDTSSYELFLEAKKLGIRRLLDMSTAYPAFNCRIMRDYARKRPEVLKDLELELPKEQMERRRGEVKLADRIMVASMFVRDSLLEQGVSADKIIINPYGVDLELFHPGDARRSRSGATRFLFVGWFSARKGIYDLLDAWKLSGLSGQGGELLLAGGSRNDLPWWAGLLPEGIQVLGRLPHSKLPELYRTVDVFVFPSLFEGFGKVILEAMASGLPVITTPHTCDERCVIEGINGFRVPSGEPMELAERMRQLTKDSSRRAQMGAQAAATAKDYTWSAYGDRCAAACRELLDGIGAVEKADQMQ